MKKLILFAFMVLLFGACSNDDNDDSGDKGSYRADIEALYAIMQENPKSELEWKFEGIGTDNPVVKNYENLYTHRREIIFSEINGEKRVVGLIILSLNISNLNPIDKLTKLTYLSCSNNQITNLDLSKNTELKSLDCDSNQITDLDLSKNTELEYLVCSSNKLAVLDLEKIIKLECLRCDNNRFFSQSVTINKITYSSAVFSPEKDNYIYRVVD